MPQLRVIADGEPLDEDDARAIWTRFSAHMDAHQGDFEGFAKKEGYVRAQVAVADGVPTLTLSQQPSGGKDDPAQKREAGPQRKGAGKNQRRRGKLKAQPRRGGAAKKGQAGSRSREKREVGDEIPKRPQGRGPKTSR